MPILSKTSKFYERILTSFSSRLPVISKRFLKMHALISSTLNSWSKMTGSFGIFCCARYKIFLAWSALPFLSNWNRAASIHTATLWGYLPTYSSYNFDNWVRLFHFSNRFIWVFHIFSSSGHRRWARRRILFKRFSKDSKWNGISVKASYTVTGTVYTSLYGSKLPPTYQWLGHHSQRSHRPVTDGLLPGPNGERQITYRR